MSAEVRRLDGVVLIAAADAATLAEALKLFGVFVAERGARLTPRIAELRDTLRAAAGDQADVYARTSVPQGPLPVLDHDLLDTTAAAHLLGCTTGNVRDLIRRRVLPARRAGGRWLLTANDVHLRAEHTAA